MSKVVGMMQYDPLTAISPVDGRYRNKVTHLAPVVSEYGLIAARVEIEIAWFRHLAKLEAFPALAPLNAVADTFLDQLLANFNLQDAQAIKSLEQTTNHDVKAMEYYLKSAFDRCPALAPHKEWIHFACTSEDINNLAYGLMLKRLRDQHLLPRLQSLWDQLSQWAVEYADIPMLSRTHGQSATPTTVGKEFANFAHRLQGQMETLKKIKIAGKFNGAVGNYNAHCVAYPEVDWPRHNETFVRSLGLDFNAYTTQIEPHDGIAELAHAYIRCNNIIRDLDRDMWGYISLGYFKQKNVPGEIGSSTMPHKINPIDFENSEGNIGIANQALHFFSDQLPVSRWQRDLVDSTVLRNLGVAFAHTDIAYQATLRGMEKCQCVVEAIERDLSAHWEVLAEAVQTVMRAYGIENSYEILKEATRGKALTKETYHTVVNGLQLPDDIKKRLLLLTPQTYLGRARELAKSIQKDK